MPSTNEALQDAATRHAIYLQRLGGANARAVLELLSEADADLVARLTARIERLGPLDKQQLGRGLATTQRLKRLLQEIRQQNAEVRRAVAAVLDGRLKELAETEVDIASRRINEAVGVDLGMLRPSPELLRAATEGAIIRGQTLKQWWGKWGDDRLRQVDGAIRLGAIEGQTTPEIARRLREGLDIQKRSADMLARTATNAVANQARDYLYQANADILQGVRWVSTLDSRTCFLAGTMVETPSGPRPIESLSAGDVVVGGSRNPRRIVETKRAATRMVAKVTLSNGTVLHCTPDHLFLTSDQQWIEAQELSTGDELAERLE